MSPRATVLLLALALGPACRRDAPPKPKPAPAQVAPRYEDGKRALAAGRLDEAEQIFRALAEAPASAGEDPTPRDNALLALASLRKERGDARGALAFARRVVERRPDDPDALDVLVALAHEAGDLPAEIDARERIVKADPDALDQHLLLAGALTAAKELERAKAAFLAYEAARTRIVVALGRAPDPAMRRAAAEALGAAHDAGTARALVLAATDRDATVRAAAVRAVAQAGLDLDPELRPALQKMAKGERDPSVRAALDEALAAPRK